MFSLGLGLEPRDFAVALRQPKALLAGLLCQVIGLPLIAFLLIRLFQMQGDLAYGVMILSCCPGGITSNVMSRWARGDVALSISYTAIVSLLTAITLPFILGASAGQFLTTTDFEFAFAPLSLMRSRGYLARADRRGDQQMRSSVASRWERCCPVWPIVVRDPFATLISQWDVLTAHLEVLGPILISLNVLMLFLGCTLGPLLALPRPLVTTLAIESGFQNGTVGIVVGAMLSQPGSDAVLTEMSLPSAVYGVLMLMTVAPFVLWRRSLGG